MFDLEPRAAAYIRERCNGAVTIELEFQPMMGGG